jgi:hypothetical protein
MRIFTDPLQFNIQGFQAFGNFLQTVFIPRRQSAHTLYDLHVTG